MTVYYTTYYAEFNKPVFDVALSYLAWKGNAGTVVPSLKEVKSKGLDARQKDDFLCDFATSLGINYETFCAKRLLQIMTPAEASELARQGVDFQLHTHRHRVSSNRERFLKEIDDNRIRLDKFSPRQATHFCYPGGYYRPEFPQWLADRQVISATTCNVGIAGPQSQLHLLPRFIDTMYATPVEFRSWLSGLASFMPQRQHVMSEGQLMEEWERSNT